MTVPPVFDFVTVQEQITEFEETFHLLEYELDGWCIWPVLRFGVISAMRKLPFSKRPKMPYPELGRLLMRDIWGLLHLPQARLIVRTNSLPLAERVGGTYKDIYFDDLLLRTGNYLKLEDVVYNPNKKSHPNTLIQNHMTSTLFRNGATVLAALHKPDEVYRVSGAISQLLQKNLALTSWTRERVAQLLGHFYWSKRLYRQFLTRVAPSFLLLITSYVAHSLVGAAKELGIEVVEFQHGFLDRLHPGYSWTARATLYKSRMPLPDQLFLYGPYWQDELLATGFWRDELRVVGSLRVDEYRYASIPKLEFPTLVLTTQYMATKSLIGYLTAFLRMAESISSLRLFIKLHPAEQKDQEYTIAFQHDPRVQVLSSADEPSTFTLLKQAHYHLSISSTCHYEALALGVPTIVLPLPSHENVTHLCQTGYAFVAPAPQDLAGLVFRQPYKSVPLEVGEQFFVSGALSNIMKELRWENQ